jgi:hypothetical protein
MTATMGNYFSDCPRAGMQQSNRKLLIKPLLIHSASQESPVNSHHGTRHEAGGV